MIMAETTDEVLMSQVALGDSSALGLLYDRYSANVYALALRMLGDRQLAEELVQETFLRVWRQASTYRMVRGALVAWILSIARNLAIDELRRRGARPQAVDGDAAERLALLESPGNDPVEHVLARIQHEAVTGALDQIPAEQRRVLELAYFGGLSQSEIATQLGDPLGTVKTRMRLGLQKLKSVLDPRRAELDVP
jgi:RNA polymerase sigma-70 factor (ECF subfamily)